MLTTILHPARDVKDRPPLVIAHGLFGSGRNWGAIARMLATRRDVVAVDMRNHGGSFWASSQSYADMAGDLAEVLASLGPADLLGHSMGGKAAMQVALTQGHLLRRLVVADIAPVAYAHDQTRHITAMRGLDLTGLTSRSEAEARLALQVDDPALRAFFLQSLDLKSTPPAWRLNLDALEAAMPQIIGWPETQGQFDGPTLFLTGSESHYVQTKDRDAIRALFPHARFAKLMGAGHWLHAEKPKAFGETVALFLDT
ncbi:MAG: alpha/beta fold hydrolase [Pseudomonadota bacterium]